jgi:hypothetical protein
MAKNKLTDTSLPGLEDPRVVGLSEGLRGLADSLLLVAGSGDEFAHEEALRGFFGAVFNRPDLVAEGAAFLARAYEGREAWLAQRAGTPELVQEMATGQAMLTCVVAGEWVDRRDFTRLVRLADGMLAARMHLRSGDCLDLMLAMASTLALVKQPRAVSLVNHVVDCQKEGLVIDVGLLEEARHRLQIADVVGAANQATREMWDQRFLNPGKVWEWNGPQERQALRDLAEWLTPGHPAGADFGKIVPAVWWDLWQVRSVAGVDEGGGGATGSGIEEASPWTGGLLAGETEGAMAGGMAEGEDAETRLRLGWFVAGGVTGALAAVLLQILAGGDAGSGESKGGAPDVEAVAGKQGTDAVAWCQEERERLAGELVHVGRLGAVKASGWAENAGFLSGLTADLPSQSQMYRKMLELLHLDPPQDAETRSMVPRLLLRRGADEKLVGLWEQCVDGGRGMRGEIAAAAREALEQPALQWTAGQRERLQRLCEVNG